MGFLSKLGIRDNEVWLDKLNLHTPSLEPILPVHSVPGASRGHADNSVVVLPPNRGYYNILEFENWPLHKPSILGQLVLVVIMWRIIFLVEIGP